MGSKIAKGKFSKVVVFRGSKAKTSGGLTQGDLVKNSRGKIVSKKSSAGQEALCDHPQGLDCRRPEGQEGFGREGLRRDQEGLSSLRESKRTLPVSIHEHAKPEGFSSGCGDVH